MGNTKLRKILKEEQRWSDKECKRHKHEFTLECNVKVNDAYYHAYKCLHCNSFICIPDVNNNLGFMKEPIPSLPTHAYYSPHKWLITFKDLKYLGPA